MNRYRNIGIKNDSNGKRYLRSVIYPLIPETLDDIYVETEYGDRVDVLAYQFYNDPSLWWIITTANPGKLKRDSYVCPPGLQIRIPLNPNPIIDEFDRINRVR
jgi:phage tail protein X